MRHVQKALRLKQGVGSVDIMTSLDGSILVAFFGFSGNTGIKED